MPLRRPRPSAALLATAAVVAAAPASATEAAYDGPSVLDIVTGTPLWVWPLLAWTLFVGWKATRDRVLAPWRLFVMPAIVVGLVTYNLATTALTAGMLVALACGAGAGVLAGRALGRRRPAERLDDGRLMVRGDWLPLTLMVGVFALRYAQGITRAIEPSLAASAAFVDAGAFVSGLFAAMMIARTVAQLPNGYPRATRPGFAPRQPLRRRAPRPAAPWPRS